MTDTRCKWDFSCRSGNAFQNGGSFSALFHYGKVVAGICLGSSLAKLPLRARCGSVPDRTNYDLVVIGGGIVGVATAREVARRHPNLQIALLEKEICLASHQSGLNSNVIHMGLYYKPGSLMAKLCVEGSEMLYKYLDEKKMPYKKCGKVVVAVNDDEVPVLNKIYQRACINKVKDISLISGEELELYEPHCKGKAAIRSPHTGVVDFGRVARSFGTDFLQSGGKIVFGFEVDNFEMAKEHGVIVITSKDGVPNPKFPFLGVHFTPRMDGSVWLGPAVVLGFSRDRHKSYSWTDVKEILTYKGLRKLAFRHWWYGSSELYNTVVMRAQLKQLQKFIPELTIDDVSRGPSGTIAQALNADGTLVEDFTFDHGAGELGSRVLHVRNAPSPAATSSMAIATHIADKAQRLFKWQGRQ